MKYLTCALLLTLLATVFLTGCQQDDKKTIPQGSVWKLETFDSAGEEIKVLPGTNITLRIEKENEFGGSAGCNSYAGSYERERGDSNSISIGPIISTEKWCLNQSIMEQESRYLSALRNVSSFEVNSDHLKLFYDNGNSSLNFLRLS
ncbi:MAG: META domain-containing protein [Archaeoglobaceae archaeon]